MSKFKKNKKRYYVITIAILILALSIGIVYKIVQENFQPKTGDERSLEVFYEIKKQNELDSINNANNNQ